MRFRNCSAHMIFEDGLSWGLKLHLWRVEKGISENLLNNKEFQLHMVHGLLNSLGTSIPNERDLHYFLYRHFSEKLDIDLKPYIEELNNCQRRCRIPQLWRNNFPHPYIRFPLDFQNNPSRVHLFP